MQKTFDSSLFLFLCIFAGSFLLTSVSSASDRLCIDLFPETTASSNTTATVKPMPPKPGFQRPVLPITRPIRNTILNNPIAEDRVVDLNKSDKIFPIESVEPPTQQEIQEQGMATQRKRFNPKATLVSDFKLSGEIKDGSKAAAPSETILLPVNRYDGIFSRMVRIQRFKKENLTTEIYDVLTGEGLDLPGLYKQAASYFYNSPIREIFLTAEKNGPEALKELLAQKLLASQAIDQILKRAEQDLIAQGVKTQNTVIEEILDFVKKEYLDRRSWSPTRVEDFMKKGRETMNNTRYVVTRDAQGKIVAVIGLTVVNYGKIKFFDTVTRKWVVLQGEFGTTVELENHGVSGHHTADGILPDPKVWRSAVKRLPVEQDEFTIDRVAVADDSRGVTPRELEAIIKFNKIQFPSDFKPDFSQPVLLYTGRAIEPVKFAVAKDSEDRGVARIDVLANQLRYFFPQELGRNFSLNGQMAWTQNTPEGVKMYRMLGFVPYKPVQTKTIVDHGVVEEWTLLYASPTSILRAVNRIKKMGADDAQIMIDFLMNQFAAEPD